MVPFLAFRMHSGAETRRRLSFSPLRTDEESLFTFAPAPPARPSVLLRLARKRSLEVRLIYVALRFERGTNSKPIISKKIHFCRIAFRFISPFWKFAPTETGEKLQLPLLLLLLLIHIHHASLFWLSDSSRRRKTTEVICFAVSAALSETEWASPLNWLRSPRSSGLRLTVTKSARIFFRRIFHPGAHKRRLRHF